jgi:CBS domain-containing protein/sporulation protein YlmC with PRC-barrel domain
MFVFFSLLLNKKVFDANNRKAGVIYDIAFQLSEQFPRAISLIISDGFLSRKYADITWEYVQGINTAAKLNVPLEKISFTSTLGTYEFTLRRDLLDQQVVDTFNRKVIRVNDVHLLRVDRELRVAHVDIGARGLVRRLGWEKTVDTLVRLVAPKAPYLSKEHFIGWKYIQPLAVHPVKGTVRLSVAYKDLAQIPSGDLGEIMVELGSAERAALFKSLDLKTQARILEGVNLDNQEALLEELEAKDAVSVLELLPPDIAADILEKMPVRLVQQLLGLMETTRAKKLSMLLSYSSESAGGLMTTEYISLPHTITVAESISRIKEMTLKTETIHSAYVVDENQKLVGSVTFRDLLIAQPDQAITEVMLRKPISVHVNDTVRSVAFKLDKYNMFVIPVLNEGGVLQGIITIDDILSKMISSAWKRRARVPAAT